MSSRMKAVAKAPVLTRTSPLKVLTSRNKDADTGSGGNADPVQLFFQSRVFEFIKEYKNNTPANLLALSNGKWRVPADKMDELLDLYISEYKQVPFSLVLLKSPVYPYPMDLDHLEDLLDGASLGSPLEVMKLVLDTLSEVLGDKREIVGHALFEQRLEKRFHVIFQDIIVDEASAIRLYQAHIAALKHKAPEVKWENIVDKSVVTSNGLRLLGSYKYPDVRDSEGKIAKGVTKDGKLYSIRRLDREGGYYQPCTINFESKTIETHPIRKNAILDRSLFRPDLTPADVIDTSMLDVTRDFETCSITDKASRAVTPEEPTPKSTYRDDNTDEIIQLLGLLNHRRFDDRNEWRDVATILKSYGGERYKESWLKFSRTSSKFDLAVAEDLWTQLARTDYQGKPLTISSLHFKAKSDSPQDYARIYASDTQAKVLACFKSNGAGVRIAELFVALHGDFFKCVNIKNKTFYQFRDHRWHKTEIDSVNLLLSSSVYRTLVQGAVQMGDGLSNSLETSRKEVEAELKHAHNVAAKLLQPGFKTSIWGEICHMLKDATFFERLDSIPHLIGFENGVYDLETDAFRDGCPEDLISLSTGYDFAVEDNPKVDFDMKKRLLTAIFEDADTCLYVMKIYAACLYGSRKFEEFYILTGQGGNGKGLFNELVLQAFGDYARTMQSTFFTEKSRNSGNATPQLADKKGVRVLIASEPEENEKLQIGRLKQISGNDQIQARALFESLFYFTPQFGIFIQCNTIPSLSKVDGGVQRRLRVIEFPFQFVENPRMPQERQADNALKENQVKSLSWKQQFMRYLIYVYQTEVRGRQVLGPSDNVLRASETFLASCNPLAEWLSTNCTITKSETDKVKFSAVFEYYTTISGAFQGGRNEFYRCLRLCGLKISHAKGYFWCRGIRLESPEIKNADAFLADEEES